MRYERVAFLANLIFAEEKSMFRSGEFVELIELTCPLNLKKQYHLRPDKRCKHRYTLNDESEIKVDIAKAYSKTRFCIDVNGNAKHKDEHPAVICVEDKVEMDYL